LARAWGPTRFFEPCEEPELRAELERLADSRAEDLEEQAFAVVLRRHALELMRFHPREQERPCVLLALAISLRYGG